MTLLPSWTVETSLDAMRIMGTTKCPKCKADHDALDALTKTLVAFVTAPDPEGWLRGIQYWGFDSTSTLCRLLYPTEGDK